MLTRTRVDTAPIRANAASPRQHGTSHVTRRYPTLLRRTFSCRTISATSRALMVRSCGILVTSSAPSIRPRRSRSHRLFGRHVLLSTSPGHFNFSSVFFGQGRIFFFVDTCCVWGGFGRFRPASTWRHNPVPFISQVPGGYYTGNTPPFIPVFALFIFRLLQTANRRPRPTNS